jgi:hypothetical protein
VKLISKTTKWLFVIFLLLSLALAWSAYRQNQCYAGSMDGVKAGAAVAIRSRMLRVQEPAPVVGFKCNELIYSLPVIDMVISLAWFLVTLTLFVSVLNDLYFWLLHRRAARRSARISSSTATVSQAEKELR